MWFSSTSKRVKELEAANIDLETKLFQSQQFERIASDKLKRWVERHDMILVAYKELKAKYEPINSKEVPPTED